MSTDTPPGQLLVLHPDDGAAGSVPDVILPGDAPPAPPSAVWSPPPGAIAVDLAVDLTALPWPATRFGPDEAGLWWVTGPDGVSAEALAAAALGAGEEPPPPATDPGAPAPGPPATREDYDTLRADVDAMIALVLEAG